MSFLSSVMLLTAFMIFLKLAGVLLLSWLLVLSPLWLPPASAVLALALAAPMLGIFLAAQWLRGHWRSTAAALLMFASPIGLAGCSAFSQIAAQSTVTVAQATAEANAAITTYGVIKGIAQVAEAGFPLLAPVVLGSTALLDPLVSKIQAEEANASTSLTTLVMDVEQLTAQANTLANATAGLIHVQPNTPTAGQVNQLNAASARLTGIAGRIQSAAPLSPLQPPEVLAQ